MANGPRSSYGFTLKPLKLSLPELSSLHATAVNLDLPESTRRDACDLLVRHYFPFAKGFCKHPEFKRGHFRLDPQETMAAVLTGLVRAIYKFKPPHQDFYSLASFHIRTAIGRDAALAGGTTRYKLRQAVTIRDNPDIQDKLQPNTTRQYKHILVPPMTNCDIEVVTNSGAIETVDNREAVNVAMRQLEKRNRRLALLIRLVPMGGWTQTQAAAFLQITKQRVGQLMPKAMREFKRFYGEVTGESDHV